MTSEDLRRIEEVFDRVLAAPPAGRAEVLERCCAGDPALRAEVESLLEHDSRAGDAFLAGVPLLESPGGDEVPLWAEKLIGQKIGSYTVVRLLGHGGMGCVFEAHQERPSRTVALKVLRPGVSTPMALARFQLEPELLARLRHPNIAQVYEAGVYEGEYGAIPYFAMEFVPGAQPLLDYADAQRLTTRQRLELFAKVCDAVHHGHQKGIIHRDIKPGNILVGADGEPKVIDFGVARASDVDVVMTTQCTHVGDLVGTLHYMSPEQCDGNPAAIDTRSDVYSLGVVLFELLTGAAPYDTSGTTLYGAIRLIKEHLPPQPSTAAARAAGQQQHQAPALLRRARELRGDIDAIVLKALEKQPGRRYASAAELAQDIRHHLSGEPLTARPPTRWTRLLRYMHRHPYTVTLIGCVSITALIALATYGAVWYLDRQPHRIVYIRDPDRQRESYCREARLLARNGRVLRVWGGDRNDSVKLAELVDRPKELGSARLAVVVHASGGASAPCPGKLEVYNLARSLDEPEWVGRIDDADPVFDPHGRGYEPRHFSPVFARLLNVFPEHPGPEIVVCYAVLDYSQAIIRVLDLAGNVLYEIWHDGMVHCACMMADVGLLVLGGLNSEVYWHERGFPKVKGRYQHPFVIFAVRPRYGRRYFGPLRTVPGDGPYDSVWYKCLYPPEVEIAGSGELWEFRISDLGQAQWADPGRAARVSISCHTTRTKYSFDMEIDERGHELRGRRVVPDEYLVALEAAATQPGTGPPDPSAIELRDLPPTAGHTAQQADSRPAPAPVEGSGQDPQ